MRTVQKLVMAMLLLIGITSAFAFTSASRSTSHAKGLKRKLPVSSYIVHYIIEDLGPGGLTKDNYKIHSYVTTNTDTLYASRITVNKNITTYFDAEDYLSVTIASGTKEGVYEIDNYFPPGWHWVASDWVNVTLNTYTYNSKPLAIDEYVTYE